ncbi:UDP-N-acetylmuramoyl-tripeptide--D-alanyl-D-alanine ligase [Brevibacillus migulae]|uniref:UDP-N-acetylmuramoyl-tripeptide--D-alanyl-D- alanine ligase n=1 Tax=Brevibacillus migulae TaxID=1644114 RepID=UPI00106E0803|nr:UDP-N-acetylmuramoyl-tripeptide--D-alanyl-D-alanine ligase [Brevibacillus migulae]
MNPISLQQAAQMAQGLLIKGKPADTVDSVHFDTRQLRERSLFVAIRGEARDGHEFIGVAAKAGAKAAIVSEPASVPQDLPEDFGIILVNDTLRAFQKLSAAYRDAFSIPMIAVTGSNGKTTTKDMIGHILGHKRSLYKTYKNLNNHLGVPYSLTQLNDSHEAAVLELGMNHAGEIDLLASLVKPQISVITFIGPSHMEYFGSLEKIALAKAELLPHTDPEGFVLLNGDSPYLRKIASLYTGEVRYYSTEGPADIWADNLVSDEQGMHFTVHFADGLNDRLFLPLFGRHNVLNVLPAIAIARHFGMTMDEIREALSTLRLSAMRFEVQHADSGAIVVNDAYNASPASMEAAISTFAEIYPDRKKVAVLGDMFELGNDSAAMHADVGRTANRFQGKLSLLVAIGEQSRHLYDAYEGEKRYFPTKEEALATLRPLWTNQYALLFKASKGMSLWTLIEALEK